MSPLITDSTVLKPKREPLRYSGSLDNYHSFEVTPVIGTEFPVLQVADLLDDDQKVRDLAITVSRRGVVFFRNQHITTDQQKVLAQKLGELTGKPSTSKLHKHNLWSNETVGGKRDDEVAVVNSDAMRKYRPDRFDTSRSFASIGWHIDMTYQNVTPDYSTFHMVQVPEGASGGDTLFASAYEVYDRLSPAMREIVDRLDAVHYAASLKEIVKANKGSLTEADTGTPENSSTSFQATHPLVRTNPVTGWKSLYGAGSTMIDGWIEGFTKYESDMLKHYFNELVSQNHDLQARMKWGLHDMVIWDNRCVYHTPTNDYQTSRMAHRVSSIGERSYFDPASVSRRQGLAAEDESR